MTVRLRDGRGVDGLRLRVLAAHLGVLRHEDLVEQSGRSVRHRPGRARSLGPSGCR
ncbi:hypothetical protein ACIO6T_24610 [Streptomyces sp. NPDC087532]|uniref:hypothetical protein n=1 Tax=Streptomyces sp. NPDC087532 TaxID=3365795 RepID=UPI0038112E1A